MLSNHPNTLPDGRIPVLISAHARDLVAAEAGALVRYLHTHPAAVPQVAHTLRATRPLRRHRAMVRARDTDELISGLDALYRGAEHPLVVRSNQPEAARTAFVFPGQGNQWPGMGAGLWGVAAYRAEADRCHEAFVRAGHRSPLGYLRGADDSTQDGGDDPVVVQAAQFTHAAALAATWRHFGVLPDITVGHSLGELAAAYTAGVVDLDAAVAVVATRAQLTDLLAANAPVRFGMAMIAVGADTATEIIAQTPGWLELSVVNGPESVVISGEWPAIQQLLDSAQRRGVFARELAVRYPAHTSALEPLRDQLTTQLPDAVFHSAPVEFLGSVYGGPIPAGTAFRQYWFDNLRRQVRFDLAAAAAVARGVTTFIEMSAHPTLLIALGDSAGAAQVLGSTDRDRPAADALAANIAAAAIADPGYRWRDFTPPEAPAPLRHFPHAPMHTNRLWAGAQESAPRRRAPVVMTESWQPATEPGRRPVRVAVDDYTGKSAELTARLVAALGASDVAVTDPEDAELLLLVAPPAATTEIGAAAAEFVHYAAAQTAVQPGRNCRRVWLLTRGAEQLDADTPPLPGPAALAALHRSTGFDYPDQTFAHIDLPAQVTDEDLRAAVGALVLDDTEVAVRGGVLATRRFVESPAAATVPALPQSVVITGGTGAIGMAYAAYCADHGAQDIVLLSRSGATDTIAAQLAVLRARTGARVTAIRCDITDDAAVAAVIAHHRPAPAGLLVHTASAEAIAASTVTESAIRDALGAKVIGLDNVVRHWPLHADARVLVCSSVLALWGGSGHGLYAAANRMADTLVGQLRAQGLGASSIRWGLWRSVAVVSGEEKDRIGRTGLTPMAPEAAITAGLVAAPNDPAILSADFDRLAVFFDSQGVPSPFDAALTADPCISTGVGADRSIADVVADELVTVLGLEGPDDIDMHRALVDLGLDSLLALDLRKRLGRATGLRVALGPLLAGMTGAQLTAVLRDDAAPPPATERTVFTHD
ncbi:SDR family NAD(P)-dependent oxidoreductase [Mycolicibacter arupensis]|uniref:SDR family NAD(P)-dependent oxidoreductase n=1 Tax=Mycolicibacter arupensis TaxID=342002 RepID=A0A5C7YF95_9MYCO|nr:SDR family NAD(P)-dependent oxidoreductase [Mycolicibacter arupensis]TXI60610.1 MAG: SDR family NAD(P)-dependent oxidoreductase [Mycolicibacter arupensis]